MRIVLDGPKVFLVGTQYLDFHEVGLYLRQAGHEKSDWVSVADKSERESEADWGSLLCEMGGRVCYDSFTKRRPGGTEAYLRHIKEMAHGRVLEHAVYSFVLTDISRACSHELYTHGAGWSKSMRSTRYVDEGDASFVCPPALVKGALLEGEGLNMTPENYQLFLDYHEWKDSTDVALKSYKELVRRLSERREGSGGEKTEIRKRARQAARYALPHSLATTVFATVNGRALRHFLETRCSPHADVEIRQLAGRVWEKVVRESPILFGDYTKIELEDGTFALETPWRKV